MEERYRMMQRYKNLLKYTLEKDTQLRENCLKCQAVTQQQRISIQRSREPSRRFVECMETCNAVQYADFIQCLRDNDKSHFADLLAPKTSIKVQPKSEVSENELKRKIQGNKNNLTNRVRDPAKIADILVSQSLLSKEHKQKVELSQDGVTSLLELVCDRGLSVMQDFMRVLYAEGFQDLVAQIEGTSVDADFIIPNRNVSDNAELEIHFLAVCVEASKATLQTTLPNIQHTAVLKAKKSKKWRTFLRKNYAVHIRNSADTLVMSIGITMDSRLEAFLSDYLDDTLNAKFMESFNIYKTGASNKSYKIFLDIDTDKLKTLINLRGNMTQHGATVYESDEDDNDTDDEVVADGCMDGVLLSLTPIASASHNGKCGDHGQCALQLVPQYPHNETQGQAEHSQLLKMLTTAVNNTKPKVYKFSPLEILRYLKANGRHRRITRTRDAKGLSVLHATVLEGRMDVLDILYDLGMFSDLLQVQVTLSTSSYYQMTALDLARRYHMTKMFDQLMKLETLEKSMTMMHKMARLGEAGAVEHLVQQHPDMVSSRAQDGSTPMYWAVTSGDLGSISALAQAGAEVCCRTAMATTVLMRAASLGLVEIVKVLVRDYQCDTDEADNNNDTAVTMALRNGDAETLCVLLECGATFRNYDLPFLARQGTLAMWHSVMKDFKNLLNLDYRDCAGKSVLHHAIEAANLDLLDELMKHHVDISCSDKRNRNVLFSAVESANIEILRKVVFYCKNKRVLSSMIDQCDVYMGGERNFLVSGRDKGILGYHYVNIHRPYLQVFADLIKSGGACDVAKYGEVIKSGWGLVPAEVKAEISQMFDAAYTEPSDIKDMTVLHFALIHSAPEMAQLLIENGANVDVKDRYGLRPVHLASMRGYLNILSLLEDKQADMNASDNDFKKTPLQVAQDNGQLKVVTFFTGLDEIAIEGVERLRTGLRKNLDDLEDVAIHKERKRGGNVKIYIRSKLRDMTHCIQMFFYETQSSEVVTESTPSLISLEEASPLVNSQMALLRI